MIYSTQFAGGFPPGYITQGIGLSSLQWVRLDGRTVTRAAYPRLSPLFPFGKLTGTVRSLTIAPGTYGLAASPTYFVAPTATSASATPIQYSTDGVTWSTTSVSVGIMSPSAVFWAGTRFLLLPSGATQACVTTGDNPNSTWVVTSVGPSSFAGNVQNKVAYSPTLGRVVCLQPGNTAASLLYTLDNGATAWVQRTGLTSLSRSGVCWSGTKFVSVTAASSAISASSDGITWTDSLIPEATSANQGSIASNGAGNVVVSGVASGLLVSLDHGVTWLTARIPGMPASDLWKVQYSGDRFFVPTTSGVAMSLDGVEWFLESQLVQGMVTASAFAKKGSVITQVLGSASSYSFNESATDFALPNLQQFTQGTSGVFVPTAPTFMRAI